MAKPRSHRLIHLDLKGAPPKLSYYEKILPLLKEWGATGLLIEYEDMFPYWDNLKILASPDAYSTDDVKSIQELAEQNNLIVIPLIQTFGHLEFVLKHEQFVQLREVPSYPNALCPSLGESFELIKQMINQMMQLHPHVKWLHIGSDEVWHLGTCTSCLERMESNQWSKNGLFLNYVASVLKFVHLRYPHVTPIMWDDMLRHIDVPLLQASGIGSLAEPMVWHYAPMEFQLPADIWDKYSAVFPNVWVASAFKGAGGSTQFLPNISLYVQNHISWLEVISSQIHKFNDFRGFAITGWQRYDHYAVMCELLPASIPSLVLCLQTLRHGEFNDRVHTTASKMLGSVSKIDLEPFPRPKEIQQDFTFPGKDIFIAMNILSNLVARQDKLVSSEGFQGWFTAFHMSCNFSNPAQIEPIFFESDNLVKNILQLRHRLQLELGNIIFPSAVEEWLAEQIEPRLQQLQKIVQDATNLLQIGARPKAAGRDVIMREDVA